MGKLLLDSVFFDSTVLFDLVFFDLTVLCDYIRDVSSQKYCLSLYFLTLQY